MATYVPASALQPYLPSVAAYPLGSLSFHGSEDDLRSATATQTTQTKKGADDVTLYQMKLLNYNNNDSFYGDRLFHTAASDARSTITRHSSNGRSTETGRNDFNHGDFGSVDDNFHDDERLQQQHFSPKEDEELKLLRRNDGKNNATLRTKGISGHKDVETNNAVQEKSNVCFNLSGGAAGPQSNASRGLSSNVHSSSSSAIITSSSSSSKTSTSTSAAVVSSKKRKAASETTTAPTPRGSGKAKNAYGPRQKQQDQKPTALARNKETDDISEDDDEYISVTNNTGALVSQQQQPPLDDEDDDIANADGTNGDGVVLSASQRAKQRREWNKANAKKSRMRKKFTLQAMVDRAHFLIAENARLLHIVRKFELTNTASYSLGLMEEQQQQQQQSAGLPEEGSKQKDIGGGATTGKPQQQRYQTSFGASSSSSASLTTSSSSSSSTSMMMLPSRVPPINSAVAEVVPGTFVRLMPLAPPADYMHFGPTRKSFMDMAAVVLPTTRPEGGPHPSSSSRDDRSSLSSSNNTNSDKNTNNDSSSRGEELEESRNNKRTRDNRSNMHNNTTKNGNNHNDGSSTRGGNNTGSGGDKNTVSSDRSSRGFGSSSCGGSGSSGGSGSDRRQNATEMGEGHHQHHHHDYSRHNSRYTQETGAMSIGAPATVHGDSSDAEESGSDFASANGSTASPIAGAAHTKQQQQQHHHISTSTTNNPSNASKAAASATNNEKQQSGGNDGKATGGRSSSGISNTNGAVTSGAAVATNASSSSAAAAADVAPVVPLEPQDYELMELITTSQQHFLITDPLAPDNPIVFVSWGFCGLTGYTIGEILGRNCRLLQGPDTDPKTVKRIRDATSAGRECHTVIRNYRKDGTPFWNDLFISPLRNGTGRVVHFVGVQKQVSNEVAAKMIAAQNAAMELENRGSVHEEEDEEDDDDGEEEQERAHVGRERVVEAKVQP